MANTHSTAGRQVAGGPSGHEAENGAAGRIEREPDAFFARVDAGYRSLAETYPARYHVISTDGTLDDLRRDLGRLEIGPFRGTKDWTRYYKQTRVPLKAREALIRIGLFGGTGEASFDDIRLDFEKDK